MGSTIWSISKEEKEKLITTLTPELVVLRAKAGISQEELSDLIGVSRQTYSAIERGAKQMSWSTFLSLILFYDCNQKTHQVLRSIKAIPQEVMLAFNAGNGEALAEAVAEVRNNAHPRPMASAIYRHLMNYKH